MEDTNREDNVVTEPVKKNSKGHGVAKDPSKDKRKLRAGVPTGKYYGGGNKKGNIIADSNSAKITSILTKDQEVEIFKALTHNTALEVGKKFGLGEHFTSDGAIRLAVHNVYMRVKKVPEFYGLTQDVVDLVTETVAARKISNNPGSVLVAERERLEFKDKLETIRDTAAEILNKKLDKLNKSSRTIDDIKIKEIADVLSMAVDKYRLVKGESTENVIHYSKLNLDNVSPEEALSLVLKARELIIDSKK